MKTALGFVRSFSCIFSFALFLGLSLGAQFAAAAEGDTPNTVAAVKITAPVDGAELPGGVDVNARMI